MTWVDVCSVADVPADSGATVLVDGRQIAVFNLASQGRWHAVDNRCPHWGEEVLGRGLIGEKDGEPWVACPMHKRRFSLETGACHAGDVPSVRVWPVRIVGERLEIDMAAAAEGRAA